jgi:two-component system nitrate/nitrite response regulator NarL
MESIKPVKAMLVSGSRLFREGLKQLLAESRYRIEAEAANAQEAVERLQAAARDIELVLVDIVAMRKDIFEQICNLRGAAPKARLAILSDDVAILKFAQQPGTIIDGYLLKDTSPDALLQLLNLTMLGEKVLPSSLVQMMIDGRLEQDGLTASVTSVGLSDREIEILRYLVDGASNKMIGNRLEIAESTVKVHMKTILRKIRMTNRTQAAIWAVEHGIEGIPPLVTGASNGPGPSQPSSARSANKAADRPRSAPLPSYR